MNADTEREAIETKAAEWLARCDRRLTAEEAVAFARWREADPRHEAAVAELALVWNELDHLLAVNGQPQASVATLTPSAPPAARWLAAAPVPRRTSLARWWPALGLAAAAAIVVVVWRSQTPASSPEIAATRFETKVGVQQAIPLADGSELRLNTDSVATVDLGTRERRVTLERGEMFVRVARDATRPFVVTAGGAEARVLGTAFGVRLRDGESVVLVTEGVVQFGAIGAPGTKLHARQEATITSDGGGLRVETLAADVVARRLAWQTGKVEFKDTPLREAAAEFNRYHAERLIAGDKATATVSIGGTFEADNLDGFLWVLESVFDVTVVRREAGEIVLGLRRDKTR
jgi:transmembrane sensor